MMVRTGCFADLYVKKCLQHVYGKFRTAGGLNFLAITFFRNLKQSHDKNHCLNLWHNCRSFMTATYI